MESLETKKMAVISEKAAKWENSSFFFFFHFRGLEHSSAMHVFLERRATIIYQSLQICMKSHHKIINVHVIAFLDFLHDLNLMSFTFNMITGF